MKELKEIIDSLTMLEAMSGSLSAEKQILFKEKIDRLKELCLSMLEMEIVRSKKTVVKINVDEETLREIVSEVVDEKLKEKQLLDEQKIKEILCQSLQADVRL